MKVLSQSDGFPPLAPVQIGLMKRPGLSTSLMTAITDHITACLDNISPAVAPDDLDADMKAYGRSATRMRAPQLMPGW
jgi:hypothetical protein